MWSCGQQSTAVVGRCRIHECVTDDYISSAAHKAALDVAHQPNDEVNILGYDKDFVVTAEKAIALLDELETAGVIDFYDGRYYLAKADSEEE